MSIDELVDLIQNEYRPILSPYDYQIINEYIYPSNYSKKRVSQAIEVSKANFKDSLKYLVAVLKNMPEDTMEKWENEIEKNKGSKLSDAELNYAIDFLRRYCDNEEEFKNKVKKIRGE